MTELTIISPQNTRFKARKYPKPTSSPKPHKITLRGKLKPKGVAKLMKEADAICSRYVRLSAADKDGFCTCYTCGYRTHYKKMHAGHYLSRYYKATRWTLSNLRPQCPMCNLWKRGDASTFRENLIRDEGLEKVEWLEKIRTKVIKLTPEFLQEIIETYTGKLASLTVKQL